MGKLKKHELLEEAMACYPAGSIVSFMVKGRTFESSGIFEIRGGQVICKLSDDREATIFDGEKWAEKIQLCDSIESLRDSSLSTLRKDYDKAIEALAVSIEKYPPGTVVKSQNTGEFYRVYGVPYLSTIGSVLVTTTDTSTCEIILWNNHTGKFSDIINQEPRITMFNETSFPAFVNSEDVHLNIEHALTNNENTVVCSFSEIVHVYETMLALRQAKQDKTDNVPVESDIKAEMNYMDVHYGRYLEEMSVLLTSFNAANEIASKMFNCKK